MDIINLQFGGSNKWNTLSHNGVIFPPEYIPHNIPLIYQKEKVQLPKIAEEFATIYAKFTDTDYITNKIFKRNFWNDFKKLLTTTKIENLDDCDFSLLYNHIIETKGRKKEIPAEEILKNKQQRELEEKKYKTALVDGKEQQTGNFRMEPPGIFLGRGCNPKLGKIKHRIHPEDITINIGKESTIPEPLSGNKWGKIIHDKSVEWLASWKDDITGKPKYVWLGHQSDFKKNSDIAKFELARKLKKKIKTIRETNNKHIEESTDLKLKQIATALYFIDNLALRVGNEKSQDEADTVGVTSLRVEHIELKENYTVKLDFLGKDSIRYKNTVQVTECVYKNLQEFILNKQKHEQLFDLINSNDLNKYLQTFMKGLTGKVFRTYNASNLFQKELFKISNKFDTYDKDDKINILLDNFNKANAKVAILCNHQKSVSKSFGKQLDNINTQIKRVKKLLKKSKSKEKYRDKLKKLRAKKELKTELKTVSLGTSKVNYIDSRITIAFMKKHNIPIDSLFTKTLQEKFRWAFDVDADYKF